MKSIASLLAAALTLTAAGSALADNQQHQTQLALQRTQETQATRTTTVAVYANERGVGNRTAVQAASPESRFELRSNAHGQAFGAYVQAAK